MKNGMMDIKKTGRKTGITARVSTLLLFVVVVVVVVGLLARKSSKDFDKTIVAQTQQHLLTIATIQAENIENVFEQIFFELETFAATPTIQLRCRENIRASEIPQEAYSAGMALFANLQGTVDCIVRLDSKGIAQSIRPFREGVEGTDFSKEPNVEYVLENYREHSDHTAINYWHTNELFTAESGKGAISIFVPVLENTKLIGILGASICLETINNMIDSIKVGRKGYAQIIDDNGWMVAHPKYEYIGLDVIAKMKEAFPNHDWADMEDIVEKMSSGATGVGVYHSAWWQDEEAKLAKKLTAFAPIRVGNELWSLGVTMGYDEVSGPVKTYARNVGIGAGLLTLVFAGAGFWFYENQKERSHLVSEAQSAEKLRSLNQQLESEIIERKQAEEGLSVVHDALNSSINGVIITNLEGMITYSNPVFLSMFEYESEDDVVSKNAADLFVSEEVRKAADVRAVIDQTKGETEEFDVTQKDGSVFPVEVSSSVVTDKEGNVVGLMGAFVDITDRKKAEAELKKHRDHLKELVKDRTAELETTNEQLQQEVTERKQMEELLRQSAANLKEANTELSQYARVVSHDIREPLRAIHNYAKFLCKDLEATLKGDQKEYLEGLGRAVREAQELVEDLLELAQVGQRTISIETIKMGVFLQELTASFELPADVEVVMARNNWPVIEVEPTLLRQIFQNLISNAIKFNQSLQKYLELGWQPVGDASYEFFVHDNGIGIAPRYQEQIFDAFERLHTKQEYEGTGIGLAIVKKATGKLGGSIRIESEPGSGSTFFVTLPKNQKEVA